MTKQTSKAGKVQSLVITGRETEYVKARDAALAKVPADYRDFAVDIGTAAREGETLHETIVTLMLGALRYWNASPGNYANFRAAVHAQWPTAYVANSWKGWCRDAAERAGIKDWAKPQSAEAKRKQANRQAQAPTVTTVNGKAQSAPQAEPAPADEWAQFLSWANSSAEHKQRALAWFKATLAAEQRPAPVRKIA